MRALVIAARVAAAAIYFSPPILIFLAAWLVPGSKNPQTPEPLPWRAPTRAAIANDEDGLRAALQTKAAPSPQIAPAPLATPSPPATQFRGDAGASPEIIRLAAGLVSAVRESLRDPDSLVVESLYYRVTGYAVCMRYRARNGFNGYNQGYVVAFRDGKLSRDPREFNAACTGEHSFFDLPTWGL